MIKKKRSKFNVNKDKSKRTFEGTIYDSEIEMNYYIYIILPLIKEGKITNFIFHPKYVLQEGYKNKIDKKILPIYYEADFEYIKNGKLFVIDIKGMETVDAKLKRKIFDYKYPEKNLHWISFSKIDGGWIETDDLKRVRRDRKKKKKITL